MLEVDKENFEAEVLQGHGVTVVDFWGPQCVPCQELMPGLEELANQYASQAKFCKLNIAGNRRLAIGQKVLGVPTVVFYKDGNKVAELAKEFDLYDVENKLTDLLKD